MPKRTLEGFLRGYGSVLTLFPQRRPFVSRVRIRPASEAFREDWEKLGLDMSRALEAHREAIAEAESQSADRSVR